MISLGTCSTLITIDHDDNSLRMMIPALGSPSWGVLVLFWNDKPEYLKRSKATTFGLGTSRSNHQALHWSSWNPGPISVVVHPCRHPSWIGSYSSIAQNHHHLISYWIAKLTVKTAENCWKLLDENLIQPNHRHGPSHPWPPRHPSGLPPLDTEDREVCEPLLRCRSRERLPRPRSCCSKEPPGDSDRARGEIWKQWQPGAWNQRW